MNRTRYPAGRYLLSVALVCIILLVGMAQAGISATSGNATYSPSQLIVQFKSGTTQEQVASTAQEWGMRLLKKVELPDTYLLERLPSRADSRIDTFKTRAVADSHVVMAQFNYIYRLSLIPGDPRMSELWGMQKINAPKAWDIEQGSDQVVVAVVDSGVFTTHEDLAGRVLQGWDPAGNLGDNAGDADNDPNPSTNPNPEIQEGCGHGTHVAGTIAAQGDNGKGVVGVCWNGVKILPIKIFADDSEGAYTSDIVAGLEFARTYGGKGVDVVNMSYGGHFEDTVQHAKLRQLAERNIVLVAAAGNESMSVGWPAAFEEVIAVSATGANDELAGYSNFGPEIDIAAPGGNPSAASDPTQQILSTWWNLADGPGYLAIQGTSMACPHVAGGAALLISSGVPRALVRQKLLQGARDPEGSNGNFNPNQYGAGIMDIWQSLMLASGSIDIIKPKNGALVETNSVQFTVQVEGVEPTSTRVWINYPDTNGNGIPDEIDNNGGVSNDASLHPTFTYYSPGVTYSAENQQITFEWIPDPDSINEDDVNPTYNVFVSAQKSTGGEAKDWGIFYIRSRELDAGLHLFSIPYSVDPVTTTPGDIIKSADTAFSLLRYNASEARYYTYTNSRPENYVWPTLEPDVHPHNSAEGTPPTGLGYWLQLSSGAALNIDRSQSNDRNYDINLYRKVDAFGKHLSGWNLIGNPFAYKVDWNTVLLTYKGRTLSLQEAIAEDWIRPTLFGYKNGYEYASAPDGVLEPWRGYWVYALKGESGFPLTMTVRSIPSASITSSRAVAAKDGWALKVIASTGGSADSYNFAGVSTRAADGYDRYDVEKPPVAPNQAVELAFTHKDWGENSGRFAKDMKSSIGSGKTWNFEVSTSQASRDIKLTWPNLDTLPKQYKATLEDMDSKTRIYMGSKSSYTYNSGKTGGVRHFSLTIEPSSKGRLLITGVTVTRNRGTGVTIGYSVTRDAKVDIKLRSANRVVRSLVGNTTRAAGVSSVVWDGKFADGATAPTGVYYCEITATDADGELAKTVRPVMLR